IAVGLVDVLPSPEVEVARRPERGATKRAPGQTAASSAEPAPSSEPVSNGNGTGVAANAAAEETVDEPLDGPAQPAENDKASRAETDGTAERDEIDEPAETAEASPARERGESDGPAAIDPLRPRF